MRISIKDTLTRRGNNTITAFQIASKASQREQILVSKVNKAKTDVIQERGSNVIALLKKLAQEADSLGAEVGIRGMFSQPGRSHDRGKGTIAGHISNWILAWQERKNWGCVLFKLRRITCWRPC